jgi:hypothetical protein
MLVMIITIICHLWAAALRWQTRQAFSIYMHAEPIMKDELMMRLGIIRVGAISSTINYSYSN